MKYVERASRATFQKYSPTCVIASPVALPFVWFVIFDRV